MLTDDSEENGAESMEEMKERRNREIQKEIEKWFKENEIRLGNP